jgi:hypothetical protein
VGVTGPRLAVFEPHRRQVHLGDDGTVEFELTIESEPIGGGSRLTHTFKSSLAHFTSSPAYEAGYHRFDGTPPTGVGGVLSGRDTILTPYGS